MTMKLRVTIGFLVFSQAFAAFGATYFVAKTGNDTNPGTEAQPFLTVQKGLNVALPGDSIRVGPGVYTENVASVRPGSAGKYITLDGQGAANVNRIQLDKSHHRVQNITVSGFATRFGSLVSIRRGAHHTILSNVVVNAAEALDVAGISWEPPGTKPFGTDAASDCLIISNRITGILADTALNIFGDNNLIVGNYVHDLGQSDFVRLWGRNNIIRGNTFTNIFKVEGVGNHIDFIQTFGENGFGSQGQIIENNKVLNIQGGQLTQLETYMVPEIRDWTFRNNIFASIAAQASCTVPEIKYYNNVFYRCNTANGGHALTFGTRTYSHGTSSAHGAQVLNNVFLECGDSRNTVGWYMFNQALTNVVADYNYVAKQGYSAVDQDSQKRKIGSAGGWSTWGGWWEPNGINGGDPGFLSVVNHSFGLLSTSSLLGRGISLPGSTADIVGVTWLNPPSIGAHEFVLDRPIPPSRLRLLQ